MIREKTVFILGAGASNPYGYPTGQELSDNIINGFSSNYKELVINNPNFDNLTRRTHIKEAEKFVEIFKQTSEFIDLFLSINPELSEIGKKAIALMILNAEKESRFYTAMPQEEREQDWYSFLFKKMRVGLYTPDSYKQFAENDVSFINFNYDRSLEYFLYNRLINLYHSQKLEDKLELKRLKITEYEDLIPFPFLHVYGKIAEIEWCPGGFQYKEGFDYQRIDDLKDNIEVIYQNRHRKDFHEIKKEIRGAKRIFFLGFGFAPVNMDILGIPAILKHEPQIFGTAFNWTPKEISEIRKYLVSSFELKDPTLNNPYIKNLNCYDLLREYL